MGRRAKAAELARNLGQAADAVDRIGGGGRSGRTGPGTVSPTPVDLRPVQGQLDRIERQMKKRPDDGATLYRATTGARLGR